MKIQLRSNSVRQSQPGNRHIAMSVLALFIATFVSLLFANARNIAQPVMIAEFDGMALFSWLIALPALAGAAGTLLFGKLSDVYGRRAMILFCIAIFSLGLGIASRSTSMLFLVISQTFMTIGHFPILPLCFAVIGDIFPPEERAQWTGLLSIPVGISALLGPVIGGVVSESAMGWRGLYWGTIPLILAAGGLIAFALPDTAQKVKPKMDVAGTLMMVAATTTLIVGFSWLGTPGSFGMGALLLAASLVAWIAFIRIEKRAEAPILDPQVLFNRTFATAAVAGLLSFFGTVTVSSYSTLFVQQVMAISPVVSGSMLTPFSTLLAFIGIPAGFVLAKTKKYRGVYIFAYALVTLALLIMWRFTAATPIGIYVLVTALAGVGLGIIPTVNTVVVQFAVPKHLLGVAVGAVYFFQMIGISASPAILGFAQSSAPDLESGLKLVFLVGAVVLAAALLLITTIPEISLHTHSVEEYKPDNTDLADQ